MALGSTQPLTEMNTRRVSWGCLRLCTLPSPCAVVMKSGNLKFLEIFGPLQACNGTALPYERAELGHRVPRNGSSIFKWVNKLHSYSYCSVAL